MKGRDEFGLEALTARVLASPEVAAAIAGSGMEPAEAARLVEIYASEAPVGLALVEPLLRPGLRILEVGSGIGLLTRHLAERGFDVTAIEPGAAGFGLMPRVGASVAAMEPALPPSARLRIGAAELDPAVHGLFDLVFSVNVMEHVPDLDGAFRGMAGVLKPGGTMIHMCPNYLIPYEPHFGIPLLPLAPRWTKRLFPARVASLPGVWDELNFITARRVRALAARHGLRAAFDRGVLARTLRRLETDPEFVIRQGGLPRLAQRLLTASGAIGLLERLPGEYLTPMVFRLVHADAARP